MKNFKHPAPRSTTTPRHRLWMPGLLLLSAGSMMVFSCDDLVKVGQEKADQEPDLPPCKFTKSLVVLQGELISGTGSPWHDLSVTIDTAGEYEFKLENEGLAGFAVYTSEGKPIVSPDNFNAHESVHVWKGQLPAGEFKLRVRMAGKPGVTVRYSLSGVVVAADGPVLVDEFTVTKGEAKVVSVCGGLSRLSFGADALMDADPSMSFIAKCTARECIASAPSSDHIEVTTADNQGYTFKDAPILDHPRVPFSVRQLDDEPIFAHEGAAQVINGERLVRARSFIPHFSHIEDIGDECGSGESIPSFPFPFVGMYKATQGNDNVALTHKGLYGKYDVDFGLPFMKEALAVADGQLYWESGDPYYGPNHLLLRIHPDQDFYYRYGHCESVSPQMLERGLTFGGDPVTVAAGEPVCLVGNEGNIVCTQDPPPADCGKHLHGTLVEIANLKSDSHLGVSKPHGYQGLHHGKEFDNPQVPVEFKTFCPVPDKHPDICPTEHISLWDGCLTPGGNYGNFTRVEGKLEPALVPEIEPPLPEPQVDPDIDPETDPKIQCLKDLVEEPVFKCPKLPELKFQDAEITPEQWYYDDLQQLVCAGAIDNAGLYEPGVDASRADFLEVLLKVSYFEETFEDPGTEPFEDVSPEDPFYKYVAFGHNKKIIEGYEGDPKNHPNEQAGKKYFRPGNPINRAEVAKVLAELGKAPGAGSRFQDINNYYECLVEAGKQLSPEFDDVAWGVWYYFPVAALRFFDGVDGGVEPDGIVCGQGGKNMYTPGDNLNRAEMAKLACMSSGLCPSLVCGK